MPANSAVARTVLQGIERYRALLAQHARPFRGRELIE
jgi:hypothetical protein